MRPTVLFAIALLSTAALPACTTRESSTSPTKDPERIAQVAARAGLQAGLEAPAQQAAPAAIQPLATKKFGAEITEKDSTPLPALMKEPGKFSAKTVRTEGVVSAVCKEMGCWMEITDAAGQAHIKMAGHSFFIPKEASGHHAVVQGKVLNADKDHCAAEAEAQTGQVAKVQIEATGVQFVD